MRNIRFLLTTLMVVMVATMRAQLVINELMQSNIDCVMDDINEFPDSWVELYNAGTTTVNLRDYRLGLTTEPSLAWQLPNRDVAPGQFVLVCCDKEESGLHTNFRLDSGKGGSVYLFKNGDIADKVEKLKKQPAPNIAYGRQNDGSDTWGYQLTPTPEGANSGEICDADHILGEPIFSEKGRVVTEALNLTLTLTMPEGTPDGAEIRYTIDGTEPTRSSMPYVTPINVTATRVIRAKLFCDGWLSPRSTTHTFIRHPRALTLPVVAISINPKYLNDPKIGIYVDGTYQSGKKNYEFDWRRPIHFEYYEGQGTPSILNQLCETRIMGGATRSNKFKSLAVYANKRFGVKRLEHEFFPDQKPGLTDFKSIALRNAGNDFDYLYMRDAIIQRTMAQHADLDWQAWRPAIVYINGEYKGMLNIRERSNDDNIYTNYDGLEDIDMIENWGELKQGDWNQWNLFKEFYNEHGHTLAEYEQWIDWQEFFNLMIMNLYYNNQDFPGNNIVMWRPREEGGRWRFVAKDTDFGLGLYDTSPTYNTIEWLYNPDYDSSHNWANKYDHTRLFRRMLEDADLKREFVDRSAIYMGDFLNERGTRAIWDPMYDIIKTEYPHHRQLINQWWPNYNDELNKARNWLSKRTNEFYKQLANFYQLGTPSAMTVNAQLSDDERSMLSIRFNGITLSEAFFDGKFFPNRSITLQGEGNDGLVVTGWDITEENDGTAPVLTHIDGSVVTFPMPSCKRLAVNVVTGRTNGIMTQHATRWQWHVDNQLTVSGLTAGTVVTLYTMQGIALAKQTATNATLRIPLPDHRQPYILRVGSETVRILP